VSTQIPIVSQPIQPILTPQNDTLAEGNKALELVKRLSKDLDYSGIATDVDTIGTFIYDDLGRRLGRKTNHNRRSPFAEEPQVRNTNATKKVVRKRVQKAPVKRIVRLCSVCRKAGHSKINCPGVKSTKKVNYVYHDVEKDPIPRGSSDDSEEPEIEYIFEEEEVEEPEIEYIVEEEVEENDECVDDDESTLNTSDRNCYASKKKWCEVEYL
jgi:hypothetical protein